MDETINELKKSIKINSEIAMTHRNPEFAYRKKGMEEEANSELKRYEELTKEAQSGTIKESHPQHLRFQIFCRYEALTR